MTRVASVFPFAYLRNVMPLLKRRWWLADRHQRLCRRSRAMRRLCRDGVIAAVVAVLEGSDACVDALVSELSYHENFCVVLEFVGAHGDTHTLLPIPARNRDVIHFSEQLAAAIACSTARTSTLGTPEEGKMK